jgi:hypothetical protein
MSEKLPRLELRFEKVPGGISFHEAPAVQPELIGYENADSTKSHPAEGNVMN